MDIKGKRREKGSALLQFCIKRSLKKDSVVCFAELLTVPRPWQHTANKVEGWSSSASLQTGQIKERTCKQQILSALAVTHLTASHCIKKKKKKEGVDLSCSSSCFPGFGKKTWKGNPSPSSKVNPGALRGVGPTHKPGGGVSSFSLADSLSFDPSDSK